MNDRFSLTAVRPVKETIVAFDFSDLEGSSKNRHLGIVQSLTCNADVILTGYGQFVQLHDLLLADLPIELRRCSKILDFEWFWISGDTHRQLESGTELARELGSVLSSKVDCVAAMCVAHHYAMINQMQLSIHNCECVIRCNAATPDLIYWAYATLIHIEITEGNCSGSDAAVVSKLKVNCQRNTRIETLYASMLRSEALQLFKVDILFRQASYFQFCGMHENAADAYLSIMQFPGFADQPTNQLLYCEAIAGYADSLKRCGKNVIAQKQLCEMENLIDDYNKNSLFLAVKYKQKKWTWLTF